MTPDALAAQLKELGFRPDQQALKDVHAALPALEAMRRRVRRAYDRSAEPAHTFDAAAAGRPERTR